MAKRYLGGGVSFEQKDVYQEFSEDEGGGGSSTLSGLTDVDISNPTAGQTLVYNAESGKWENGAGGGASAYFVDCAYIVDTHTHGVTITSSKTAAEIQAAVESGALVYIRYTVPADVDFPAVNHVYPLNSMVYATDEGVTRARFSFESMALGGSPTLCVSEFTLLTDSPVFTNPR